MINNSALSMTMDVAQLAPKAATVEPRRGDGAFGEALAGAHGVHDRRESRDAAAPSRREWAQGDRTTERTTGLDRAAEVRSDRAGDRPARTEDSSDEAADAPAVTDEVADATGEEVRTDDAPAASSDATTDPEAAAAGTTVAVAAAPVQSDVDAVVVPTTRSADATDAVDAAIRMAIKVDAAATGEEAAVAATTTTADGDVEVDAKLQAALLRGAEDAQDGDVQAGPTSPSTSRPASASGPSPVQLAAATFTEGDDAVTTQAVAIATTSDVAEGDAPDVAAAQLVQAAATGDDEAATDVEAATVQLKAAKADGNAQSGAAVDDLVEADVPEAVQAARLNQQQAPTVNAAAQQQAAAQAKAAEKAAEEGGDAAPPKLEPLPAQASANATAAREAAPGIRIREGLLTAHQQQRIDHIAEQLATRLRLSQAAGGSQVQLSLKPRELGEVTVQMQVREGVVAATILVDKADTARTMQANIDDLKRSLEQQGLSIQQFSVDVRGEAGAGGANARAAAEQHRASNGSGSGSTNAVAGAAAGMPGFDGDDAVSAEDVHDGDVSVLA